MTFTSVVSWLHQALLFGSFLMLAALGELLTEKAGNLNLGTPGTMCVGASAGIVVLNAYKNGGGDNPFVIVLLAVAVSFLAAACMGGIFCFFTTTLRINQNVVGLVLTIFGTGLAKFLSDYFIKSDGFIRFDDAFNAFSARIPMDWVPESMKWLTELLFGYGFMFYFTIICAVLMTLYFNKTRLGLSLRAVGENPGTADAVGINVTAHKYIATLIGSGLTGMAGIVCTLEFKEGTWNTTNVPDILACGWLAVALVIFAIWKPVNLLWASPVFGICYWSYQYLTGINTYFTRMLPYLVTIIVLVVISMRKKKENQGPQALGMTYFREDR